MNNSNKLKEPANIGKERRGEHIEMIDSAIRARGETMAA